MAASFTSISLDSEIPLTEAVMRYLVVFSGTVFAETMYVKDVLRLPLRTGQSTEYKIIAVIESGMQVEVLQVQEDWTQVRLPNQKELHGIPKAFERLGLYQCCGCRCKLYQ